MKITKGQLRRLIAEQVSGASGTLKKRSLVDKFKDLFKDDPPSDPDAAADATFDFREKLARKGNAPEVSAESRKQYDSDLKNVKPAHKQFLNGALIWWTGNSGTAKRARDKHEHYPGWNKLDKKEKAAVIIASFKHTSGTTSGDNAKKYKGILKKALKSLDRGPL